MTLAAPRQYRCLLFSNWLPTSNVFETPDSSSSPDGFVLLCLILQGKCPNCFVIEKQLQSKIVELRDKEVVTIEMQQLCAKMEKQLVQQVRDNVITISVKRIVS